MVRSASLAVLLALAGCGGGSSDEMPANGMTNDAVAAAGGAIPDRFTGIWDSDEHRCEAPETDTRLTVAPRSLKLAGQVLRVNSQTMRPDGSLSLSAVFDRGGMTVERQMILSQPSRLELSVTTDGATTIRVRCAAVDGGTDADGAR